MVLREIDKYTVMKAILTLISAVLLVSTFSFAGNGENAVDKLVNRKIQYPEWLRSKQIETKVMVTLHVNEAGAFEISEIHSDSPEMIEAVKKQIAKLKLKVTPDIIGKDFSYTFNFKIQQ